MEIFESDNLFALVSKTDLFCDAQKLCKNILSSQHVSSPLRDKVQGIALEIMQNITKELSGLVGQHNPPPCFDTVWQNIYVLKAFLSIEDSAGILFAVNKLEESLFHFQKKRKKILILTSSYGSGHMTAAKSVAKGLGLEFGLNYETKVVDFLQFCNKFLDDTVKKSYLTSLKYAPKIFQALFKGTDKAWQIKLFNLLSLPITYSKIKQLLQRESPDIIVSTYPLWNYTIKKIWGKMSDNPQFVTVITDSTRVHRAWILDSSSQYLVTDDDTVAVVHNMGVPSENIHAFGFPIDPSFRKKYSQKAIRTSFGLDPSRFTILYALNGNTTKKQENILKKLNEKNPHIQLIIVTGEDSSFQKKCASISWNMPVKIFAWTDRMAECLCASDLVVSKAGGATTAEILYTQKPVLVNKVIPAQEEGNVSYLEKHGLGICCDSLSVNDFSDFLITLSTPKNSVIAKLRAAHHARAPKTSSLDIARYLHSLLSD